MIVTRNYDKPPVKKEKSMWVFTPRVFMSVFCNCMICIVLYILAGLETMP